MPNGTLRCVRTHDNCSVLHRQFRKNFLHLRHTEFFIVRLGTMTSSNCHSPTGSISWESGRYFCRFVAFYISYIPSVYHHHSKNAIHPIRVCNLLPESGCLVSEFPLPFQLSQLADPLLKKKAKRRAAARDNVDIVHH